ncbi:hypothetical protein CEXT_619131 [Caerostris extrusa]|uniref:Uncharacterized protein n=1 Tax=Caerostris extrusa TaxID=172846 RepID=A0AAV4XM35_CAEEX|nr:hypothetical protein CEXT_619131 [Caerostris extrusa]
MSLIAQDQGQQDIVDGGIRSESLFSDFPGMVVLWAPKQTASVVKWGRFYGDLIADRRQKTEAALKGRMAGCGPYLAGIPSYLNNDVDVTIFV